MTMLSAGSDPGSGAASGGRSEEVSFGSLRIGFDARVLRPREWTVAQSRWAAELLEEVPAGPVLELCAGVGQIGLLAVVQGERCLVSVDASPVASSYARHNAERAGLRGRVEVRTGPMDRVLDAAERFPLVLADPPWVPSGLTDAYPDDPLLAIDGGMDGMTLVRTTLEVVGRHLLPGGAAVLQVGSLAQATEVERLAVDVGLRSAATRREERGVLVLLRHDLEAA